MSTGIDFKSLWFKDKHIKELVIYFENRPNWQRVFTQELSKPGNKRLFVGYQLGAVVVQLEDKQGVVSILNAHTNETLVSYNKTLAQDRKTLLKLINEHNDVIQKDLEKASRGLMPMRKK